MAKSALPRLTSPGSLSGTAMCRPSGSRTPGGDSAYSGCGIANPHPELQRPSVQVERCPQRGHTEASSVQRVPGSTHTVFVAASAASTTCGSAAFATTVTPLSASARAQTCDVRLTSWVRSSWSRVRLRRTTTSGDVCRSTDGTCSSSVSRTAVRLALSSSALRMPGAMFAPVVFVATSPPRAAAMSRVVVDLPFVPETRTPRRPAGERPQRVGRDGESDAASDDGAGAAAEAAGEPAGEAAGPEGGVEPDLGEAVGGTRR